MATTTRFKLPDVGEGLTEAEVVHWYVGVGDVVEVNQPLCDVETAKSVVELPSPVAGVVEALLVSEGETIQVGAPLVSFRMGGAAEPVSPPAGSPALSPDPPAAERKQPLVLVGTGPSEARSRRRRLQPPRRGTSAGTPAGPARAAPHVRRLARDNGVDIDALAAGHDRLVSDDDVLAAIPVPEPVSIEVARPRETRVAVRGVRRAMARAMVSSAFTAPHVTEWLTVDATEAVELVARLRRHPAWAGVRMTPLVLVARALLLAVRRYPGINARWDEEAGEIVQPHYVNLGIAAATERGLVVPNVKDAEGLSLVELARAIDALVATARAGRTPPADMSGGTITITNIGALGVDAATPILNPGEAAILAMGAIRPMPWVVDGRVEVRQVAHLALSFDHRLVDGELGSRVLVAVGEALTDPGVALAQG